MKRHWMYIPNYALNRARSISRYIINNRPSKLATFIYFLGIILIAWRLKDWTTRSPTPASGPRASFQTCKAIQYYDFDSNFILNVGSTERLHNVLRSAVAGLPTSIGMIGGSVTACHGIDGTLRNPFGDPLSVDGYPRKVYNWWTEAFPFADHQLANGAARRTDVSYFAYCHEQHLPELVDLIIVELDSENTRSLETMYSMEVLVRSLLSRPHKPAVILLGHYSPHLQTTYGYSGPDLYHKSIAEYYKIPYISLKSSIYQQYLSDPQDIIQKYYIDSNLPNPRGHGLLANLLISYFATELCKLESTTLESSIPMAARNQDLDKSAAVLPPPITATPNDVLHPSPPQRPYCASADNLMDPVTPHVSSGWTLIDDTLMNEKWNKYWFTTVPGSILQIPIEVSAGTIGIYHAVSPDKAAGVVKCWVDDNTAGAVVINGFSEMSASILTYIDRGVSAGTHYVVCESFRQPIEGTDDSNVIDFKLYGIFAT